MSQKQNLIDNNSNDIDEFLEKTIFKVLKIFFIYQYLLMLMIVIVVFLLCRRGGNSG